MYLNCNIKKLYNLQKKPFLICEINQINVSCTFHEELKVYCLHAESNPTLLETQLIIHPVSKTLQTDINVRQQWSIDHVTMRNLSFCMVTSTYMVLFDKKLYWTLVTSSTMITNVYIYLNRHSKYQWVLFTFGRRVYIKSNKDQTSFNSKFI